MGTDPPADGGQGIPFPDQVNRFEVLFFLDKLNITLHVDLCGASRLTRSMPQFQDARNIWYRLRILFGNRFASPQIAIELVRDLNRANGGAVPTVVTDVLVHVPGRPFNGGNKSA